MQRHNLFWWVLAVGALLLNACGSQPASDAPPAPTVLPSATAVLPTPAGDLLAEVRRRGVLRIATDANYAPQSFQHMDGTWEGFDIEVGRAIARRLGVRAEFLDIAFDAITPGGWNDRWDIHVGSMTITPARKQALLFTTPYYYTPAVFAVRTSSTAQTLADLHGAKVGVGTSTTYLDYLNNKLTLEGEPLLAPAPAARIEVYETDQLALQDLAQGRGLDAVLTALPTVYDAIKKGEPLRLLGTPVYYEDLAVALDRKSTRAAAPLADEITRAIQAMHTDGTLIRLSQTFYGVDITTKSAK